MRVSASFVLERDRAAPPGERVSQWRRLRRGGVKVSYPTLPGRGFPDPCDPWGLRRRTLPGLVAPAGRARLPRQKTQYKCGQSGVRNNHPLGKARVRSVAIARTRLIAFVGVKRLRTGLSNGAQMLVHSATDGSTKLPAIRAMARLWLEAFRTVGLKA